MEYSTEHFFIKIERHIYIIRKIMRAACFLLVTRQKRLQTSLFPGRLLSYEHFSSVTFPSPQWPLHMKWEDSEVPHAKLISSFVETKKIHCNRQLRCPLENTHILAMINLQATSSTVQLLLLSTDSSLPHSRFRISLTAGSLYDLEDVTLDGYSVW